MIVVCSVGFYGKNCSEECSSNCNVVKECDKIIGVCNGGCKLGWIGIICNDSMYCKII